MAIEHIGSEDDRPLSSMSAEQDAVCSIRNMEQRRQSSIDQHWAMPNKVRSLDDEPPVHHAVQGITFLKCTYYFCLWYKLFTTCKKIP